MAKAARAPKRYAETVITGMDGKPVATIVEAKGGRYKCSVCPRLQVVGCAYVEKITKAGEMCCAAGFCGSCVPEGLQEPWYCGLHTYSKQRSL